jgi:hypothetical protein
MSKKQTPNPPPGGQVTTKNQISRQDKFWNLKNLKIGVYAKGILGVCDLWIVFWSLFVI